ncbi:RHS repeat domain-containing protein, partial [Kordiimonas sp.]|uniref:RHS repeat domain-containing protein n=1 Tax=Kordiimonas sp. TaxID=1970157 RepID=UPI003A8FA75C
MNKIRVCSSFLAGLVLGLGVVTSACSADLPSMKIGRADLVSPSAGVSYYGNGTGHTSVLKSDVAVEIQALAAALRYDPDLIYAYVKNRIEITPLFGLQKGALGAYLDGHGTAFDQAQLMLDLLKACVGKGTEVTEPKFVIGTLTLDGTEFEDWLGVSDAAETSVFLGQAGIPASVTGAGALSGVTLVHAWVQVKVNGVSITFDPAYKKHHRYTGVLDSNTSLPGVSLETAASYSRGDLLTGAGGTEVTPDGVSGVAGISLSAVRTKLNEYADVLLSNMQLNGAKSLEELIGGKRIIDEENDGSGWSSTGTLSASIITSDVPDAYRTRLRVCTRRAGDSTCGGTDQDIMGSSDNINAIFYVDEIYGRKLELTPDIGKPYFTNRYGYPYEAKTFTARLRLDGKDVPVMAGLIDPSHSNRNHQNCGVEGECGLGMNGRAGWTLEMEVDHPYAANSGSYMDSTVQTKIDVLTTVNIVHGWGYVGGQLASKWSTEYGGDANALVGQNSDTIEFQQQISQQDNTKAKIGVSWLAQLSRANNLLETISGRHVLHHHSVGAVYSESRPGATGLDNHVYFTVGDQIIRLDVSSGMSVPDSSVNRANAMAQTVAAVASTLEGSVFEQQLDAVDVSSTAERFAWGAEQLSAPKYLNFTTAQSGLVAGLIDQEDNNAAGCVGYSLPATPGKFGAERISDYLNNSYSEVLTINDEFLGPGYKCGTSEKWPGKYGSYAVTGQSLQRGAAFVATKEDALGYVAEVAHIVSTSEGGYKGGSGAIEQDNKYQFDPAKAADLLKDEFEDRSVVHGVDLSTGDVAWSSGTILSVGSGGFPYELSFEVKAHNGDQVPSSVPPSTAHWSYMANNSIFSDNMRSEATMSGSAMEAMGASHPWNAVGSIVALYATYDMALASYEVSGATNKIRRRVLLPFINSWWSDQLSDNVISVSSPSGGFQFVRLPNGSYNAPLGSSASLVKAGVRRKVRDIQPGAHSIPMQTQRWVYDNVSLTVTTPAGDVLRYDPVSYITNTDSDLRAYKHLLKSIHSPSGFGVDFTYDIGTTNRGIRLKQVKNDLNRELNWNYNGADGYQVVSVDDGQSHAVSFTERNGLRGFTSPAGGFYGFDGIFSSSGSQTQRPNRGFRLVSVYLPGDTTHPALSYDYNADWRVVAAKDALGVRNNRPAYYFHVASGFRGERVAPSGNSYVAYYGGFDGVDTYGKTTNEVGETVTTTFDSWSRVSSRLYPEGNRHLFEYDLYNNVIALSKENKALSLTHGAAASYGGARCSGSGSVKGAKTKPSSVTDFRGKTTTLCYTANGQVARATQPAVNGVSAVHEYAYNGVGQVVRSVSPEGIVTVNDYDGMGNLVKTVSNCGNASAVATSQCLTSNPEERPVTSYAYDAIGNMVQVNGPYEPAPGEADDVVTTFYDTMRRPVYQVAGDINPGTSLGNIVSAIKGAKVGTYTHTAYDALGRPTGVTTYGYNYKNNGNAIPLPPSWVNSAYMVDGVPCSGSGKVCVTTTSGGGRSDYRYDALDRVEYVEAFVDGNISRNRTTRTEYDPVGRVRKVWQGWGSADEIRYQEYGYTPNGQVDWVADANGNKTQYQYDGFDRLERTYFPDEGRTPNPSTMGSHNPNDFEEYHYDGNGNIVAKRTRKGDWIKSEYDALNRLDLKKVYQGGSWSGSMVSGGSLEASVDYSYLLDGRDDVITQIPGSGGTTVPYLSLNYGYDSAGRQTSEEITRYDNGGVMLYSRTVATEFDRAGNRVQLTLPGVTAGTPSYPGLPSMAIDYGYDYRGLLTDISADGQVIASHKYDGFGRRTDLRRKPGGNKELITSYAYETDGALSALGHVFEQAGSYSVDFEYQRNLMNQLTRVATLNEKYHHPVLNNRVVTYTPDGLNQYDEIKTDGTVETLEYDDNGSLTAQGDWSYSYDAENRLVYAENVNPADAASVVYEYGPKGRRFAKVLTKGGATTRTEYLYDGDEPVADYLIKSGGDRLKARYINGAGVDERLALMQYSDTTGSR